MKIYGISIWLCFFFPLLLLGQQEKRANVWHFGDSVSVDFNTQPPTLKESAITNPEGEGSASICDTLGQLLFYTNGEKIWNHRHEIMEGGGDLWGGTSVTQSSIIVPSPGAAHQYYVFYLNENFVDQQENKKGQLYFALVDMNRNDGLGEVLSVNNQIHTNCTEKLTVIRHCNKKDYWIISHEFGNDRFVVWLLTEEGVSTEPIKMSIGSVHSLNNGNRTGYLVASPLGTKLALGIMGGDRVEVFDFDTETGAITQPIRFSNFVFRSPYGVAFSPNGKRLYVTNFADSLLLQINLDLPTIPEIKSSVEIIAKTTTNLGGMQNAPDGKLYVNPKLRKTLAVIHNPNEIGIACNFEEDYIQTGTDYNGIGLPNFIPVYFRERDTIEVIEAKENCDGIKELEAITNIAGDSVVYQWYYEKELLPNSNSTRIQVENNGAYEFKAYVYTNCKTVLKEYSETTTIEFPEKIPLGIDSIITSLASCDEANATLRVLTSGGQGTVQFSINDTLFQPTARFDSLNGGNYSITIKDEEDCIQMAETFIQNIPSPTVKNIRTRPTQCGEELGNVAIEVVGGLGTVSASLGDGSIETDYIFENLGAGEHQLFLTDETGCTVDTTVSILQLNCPFYIPNAFSPNGDGNNDQFQLYPHADYVGQFKWFRIYDRWGNLVFETNTPDQADATWNGNYKGKKVATGVYFYYVEVMIDGRVEIFGGTLNLL